MTDRPPLVNPRLRVVLDDGTDQEIQVTNPDLIRWDRTRAVKKWPSAQDAPIWWLTFIAWAALTRESTIAMKYEEFETRAVVVQNLQTRPEDVVDPTQLGPGPI